MACFRFDEMQVRDNEYDQNYYMDIERWNDLAPNFVLFEITLHQNK